MFLSGNSMVLLCIDLKRHTSSEQRSNQLLYWLSALNTAAEAHNQKLRVIICGTHCDQCDDMKGWAEDRSAFITTDDFAKLEPPYSSLTAILPFWRLQTPTKSLM